MIGPTAAAQLGLKVSTHSKYNVSKDATTRTVRGIKFDSILEADFYRFLLGAVPAGGLKLQMRFLLVPGGRVVLPGGGEQKNKPITFKVDFAIGKNLPDNRTLLTTPDPRWPEEMLLVDVKGKRMRDYIMRKKMLAETFKLGIFEADADKKAWLELIPIIQKLFS